MAFADPAQAQPEAKTIKEDPASRQRAITYLWLQVLGANDQKYFGNNPENFKKALAGIVGLGNLSADELRKLGPLFITHGKAMLRVMQERDAAEARGYPSAKSEQLFMEVAKGFADAFARAKKALREDPGNFNLVSTIYYGVSKFYAAEYAQKSPEKPMPTAAERAQQMRPGVPQADIEKDQQVVGMRADLANKQKSYAELQKQYDATKAKYDEKNAQKAESKKGKEEKNKALAGFDAEMKKIKGDMDKLRKEMGDTIVAIGRRREDIIASARPTAAGVVVADRLKLMDVVERWLMNQPNMGARDKAAFRRMIATATPEQLEAISRAILSNARDEDVFAELDLFYKNFFPTTVALTAKTTLTVGETPPQAAVPPVTAAPAAQQRETPAVAPKKKKAAPTEQPRTAEKPAVAPAAQPKTAEKPAPAPKQEPGYIKGRGISASLVSGELVGNYMNDAACQVVLDDLKRQNAKLPKDKRVPLTSPDGLAHERQNFGPDATRSPNVVLQDLMAHYPQMRNLIISEPVLDKARSKLAARKDNYARNELENWDTFVIQTMHIQDDKVLAKGKKAAPAYTVSIVDIKGKIEFSKDGGKTWVPLQPSDKLVPGNMVRPADKEAKLPPTMDIQREQDLVSYPFIVDKELTLRAPAKAGIGPAPPETKKAKAESKKGRGNTAFEDQVAIFG